MKKDPIQYVLTINGAKNVTVNFKKNYYSVKINTVGEGKIVKTFACITNDHNNTDL